MMINLLSQETRAAARRFHWTYRQDWSKLSSDEIARLRSQVLAKYDAVDEAA